MGRKTAISSRKIEVFQAVERFRSSFPKICTSMILKCGWKSGQSTVWHNDLTERFLHGHFPAVFKSILAEFLNRIEVGPTQRTQRNYQTSLRIICPKAVIILHRIFSQNVHGTLCARFAWLDDFNGDSVSRCFSVSRLLLLVRTEQFARACLSCSLALASRVPSRLVACPRLSDGGKEENSRGRRGDWGGSAPLSPGSLFIAALFFFLSTFWEPGTGYEVGTAVLVLCLSLSS